jgi:hypothetical protein
VNGIKNLHYKSDSSIVSQQSFFMATSVLDTAHVREGVQLDSAYISSLVKTAPKAAYFYINADTHDVENTANGSLTIHDADALVHPEQIPHNMFEYVIAAPILHGNYNDDYFVQRLAELKAAVPQYSKQPASLEFRDESNNGDVHTWTAELGQVGAFAGVFKEMQPNQRDANYYIVVKGGAEAAAAELRAQLIAEGNQVTYGKLLTDDRVSYVNSLALRNVKRLAYNIASALGVPIHHVRDLGSGPHNPDVAIPYRAEPAANPLAVTPGIQQSISTIQSVSWKGADGVGIFHKVRPVEEAMSHNLVIGNPYDGLHLFKMSNATLGYALPADTGAACNLDKAELKGIEKRHVNVVWDGPQKTLKSLAKNVNHEVDNEFYGAMVQHGWKQSGKNSVSQMIPVILKVSNIELKRL